MRLLVCFFLGLSFPPASAAPGGAGLSAKTADQLRRLEARIAATPTGRRLIAETSDVPRLEDESSGAPIRYLRSPSVIAFDPRRMSFLTDWEVELALVRELARASFDVPLEMPEGEMAAYLKEMRYCLERAGEDADFDGWLRRAFSTMGKRHQARQVVDLRGPHRVGAWKEPPLAYPRSELDRVGYYLYLFSRDPEEFYWAVEWGLPFGPEAVKWSSVEDFMERHRDELSAISVQPGAAYVRLHGRRYSPALVRAAQFLAGSGEKDRIAKTLQFLEDDSSESLRAKIRDWSKSKAD